MPDIRPVALGGGAVPVPRIVDTLITFSRHATGLAVILAVAIAAAASAGCDGRTAPKISGSGGAGGAGGAGGMSAPPGTGGAPLDCATVGCGAPPLCSEGCHEACGCCPCAMGETSGDLVCTSDGCFAPATSSDGGVDAAPPAACEAISTEYANALFKARECDAAQPNQCAVHVRAGFFCNCMTWANGDATTLTEIISRYIGAGCETRCIGSCGALQFTTCEADATSSTGARCLPPNVVSLTASDNNRSLTVPVGEEIDITLQAIGPNDYGTQVDVSSSALTVLEVTIAAGPVNPGGPIRLYRLRAIAPGTATVTIPYIVADMSAGASPPFTLTITVTGGNG